MDDNLLLHKIRKIGKPVSIPIVSIVPEWLQNRFRIVSGAPETPIGSAWLQDVHGRKFARIVRDNAILIANFAHPWRILRLKINPKRIYLFLTKTLFPSTNGILQCIYIALSRIMFAS